MKEKQNLFDEYPDTYRYLLEKRAGLKNEYLASFAEGGYKSVSTIDSIFKLAKVEFLLKNYSDSLRLYKKGIKCSQKIMDKNDIMILNAKLIVGEICLLANKPLEAMKNAQEVLEIKKLRLDFRISALKLLSKTYRFLNDQDQLKRTAIRIKKMEQKINLENSNCVETKEE